jgi:DNA-binding NarL/FixJ family response regulator
MDTCRVLVAERNPQLRRLIWELLDTQPHLYVVGEAGDGDEAVQMALQTCPDVVLMEIRLPKVNGLDASRFIVNALASTKIVLLSLFDLPEYREAALASGASYCLAKPALHAELMPVIEGLMTDQAKPT